MAPADMRKKLQRNRSNPAPIPVPTSRPQQGGQRSAAQSRPTPKPLPGVKLGTNLLNAAVEQVSRITPKGVKQYFKNVQAGMAADAAAQDKVIRTIAGNQVANAARNDATGAAINKVSDLTNVDPRIVGAVAALGQAAVEGKVGLDALRVLPKALPKALPAAPVTRQARGGGVQRGIQRQVQASRGVPVGEVGAVYPAGHPRAGTVKQGGVLRSQYPDKINDLEDALEQFYQKTNEAGGKLSKAYPPNSRTVLDFGDGTEAYAFDGGNFNFANRNGIRVKTRPTSNKPNPLPNVSTQVQAPKPEPIRVSKKPAPLAPALSDRRYQPQPTPAGKTISREQKVALLNPDPQDLKAKTKEFYSQAPVTDRHGVSYSAAPKSKLDRPYTVPASDKLVKVTQPDGTSEVVKIEGAKSIQERVRQIPGNEDVVVDSMQAHHRNVLKESTDFMQYFDDPSLVRAAYEKAGIHAGDDVMQRVDLPVRLHQTDPSVKYDGYRQHAAHARTRGWSGTPEGTAGTPIEAERGMSRWGHLAELPNDEARLAYLEQHLQDLKKSEQIALEAYYQQFLLQPDRQQFGVDPYIGNFGQQVLAPHNKLGDKLRQAYINRRRKKGAKPKP